MKWNGENMFGIIDLVSIAAIFGSAAFVWRSIRVELKAKPIN
jgi:hypothetical protein